MGIFELTALIYEHVLTGMHAITDDHPIHDSWFLIVIYCQKLRNISEFF